eukprot:2155750-Pleurochrysis_carterae.AAC.1
MQISQIDDHLDPRTRSAIRLSSGEYICSHRRTRACVRERSRVSVCVCACARGVCAKGRRGPRAYFSPRALGCTLPPLPRVGAGEGVVRSEQPLALPPPSAPLPVFFSLRVEVLCAEVVNSDEELLPVERRDDVKHVVELLLVERQQQLTVDRVLGEFVGVHVELERLDPVDDVAHAPRHDVDGRGDLRRGRRRRRRGSR